MNRKHILIVEDDTVGRKLVRDALLARGYETSEAVTGEDALAQAVLRPPDLVVMDLQLPGIDGLETTRRLRAEPGMADVPVVAVTAHAIPGDEERVLQAGCRAYLPKPLHFARFTSLIDEILNGA